MVLTSVPALGGVVGAPLVLLSWSTSKPLTKTEGLHFALDDIRWCDGEKSVFVIDVVKPYCTATLRSNLLKTEESSQLFLCLSILWWATEVS